MSDLGDFTNFDPDDEGSSSDGEADDSETTVSGDADPADATAAEAAGTSATESTDDFEAMGVTPPGEDRGIGVISASEGLRISEEDDET
ncbi:MAG: AAA family ATPase, partial [Haloarculaceae archaeon]